MFQAHGQASVHIRFISEQTRSFAHPSRKMACPKMEHVTSLVMTTRSSENKEQFHQASHSCRDESLEHSLGAGHCAPHCPQEALPGGRPSAGLWVQRWPEAPHPPTALSLVRPGGPVSQGSGPQPAPSRDRQQCPYQALL